jgi:lysyl-tRNA synthetase class 2
MKRMLAHGCGPIYQISRVFRDGEAGHRHNPEFSLLEWYRPDFSLAQLIAECVDLLTPLLQPKAVKHYRFRDVFKQHTGLDPLTASNAELSHCANQFSQLPELDSPALVDWLMASVVEPALAKNEISVIEDFPSWAAALAQCHQDSDGQWVAQRFEIYAGGFELANGYHELLDAAEQRARFTKDRALRQQQGLPDMAPDPWLLAALEHGLPACSGVVMGLDRLLMAQLGVDDIRTLLTFPTERA